MTPKKNSTQTATVHDTDTYTSVGHANNQAVNHKDLNILAQNITNAIIEQIRAIISSNNDVPQQ